MPTEPRNCINGWLSCLFNCVSEISRGGKITFSADWWTLGVLSYELITGKVSFVTRSKL